jgi:DNA-binding CsgD family transcriptional regulator
MAADPLSKLSEGQRRCLRLVLAHKSSKDIARELNISSHTVDQRLKLAMKILGASSRVGAAQRHAQLEAQYQPLIYQSPDIVRAAASATNGASADAGVRADAVAEQRAVFELDASPSRALQAPVPIKGRSPSELGTWQRIGWIVVIMLAIALVFGVFVAGLEGLSRLGRAFR